MMEDFKITYKGKTVGRIEHIEHRATIELRARVDQNELTSQHTLSCPEGSHKLIMAMRQELIDANNPAQRLEWFQKYLTETMVQQTISQEIEANMGKEERLRMSVMTSRGPIIIDENIDPSDMKLVIWENEDIQRLMASVDRKEYTMEKRIQLFIECANNVLTKKIRHTPDSPLGIPFDPKSVIFDEFDREELISTSWDQKRKIQF